MGRDLHHDRCAAGWRRIHVWYADSLIKAANYLWYLTSYTVVSLKSYPDGLFYLAMAIGVYVSHWPPLSL